MIESFVKAVAKTEKEGMKEMGKGGFKDQIPDFTKPNAGGMGGFKDKIPDFSENAKNDKSKDYSEKKMNDTSAPEDNKDTKEDSPYSKEIMDSIASQEELDYYIENDYIEIEINGKKVLVPKDLDLNRVDEDGKTNLERMKEGKPPLDEDGKPYNLHHIGQNPNGPFALIPDKDHKAMDSFLHDKTKSSEIDRIAFQSEKKEIYKELAKKIEEGEF
jgi:HNH/ENDO VII superfamily nuclease